MKTTIDPKEAAALAGKLEHLMRAFKETADAMKNMADALPENIRSQCLRIGDEFGGANYFAETSEAFCEFDNLLKLLKRIGNCDRAELEVFHRIMHDLPPDADLSHVHDSDMMRGNEP
jgi:hypothetical protein